MKYLWFVQFSLGYVYDNSTISILILYCKYEQYVNYRN